MMMDEEAMLTASMQRSKNTGLGFLGWLLFCISWLLVVITFPFSLCVLLKVVLEYERAVIFRLGQLLPGGAKGPGLFIVLPCIESYKKVDLRTITLGVPPQELLTKDSVTVSVDAVVYYRVSNAIVSVTNVKDTHHSTKLLAQTSLRNILGTKNLHEILSDRDSIAGAMQHLLDEATADWGIKVERVEIKDARLPENLQRAMAAEAEAAREARAKVIAAKGEQKASGALRAAAETMEQAPAALQLRFLQGRIVEIDAAPVEEEQIKEAAVKTSMSDNATKTKDCSTNENAAKEEMEALAENEELIRDWLDDTV